MRKYDYTYDKVGRLTGAAFNQYTGTSFNKTAGVDYSVSNLSYDLSGNLKTMIQKGLLCSGTSSTIYQLTYGYQGGTNRLIKITDATAIDSLELLVDFQDGNKSGYDYTYNGIGRLTKDLNKKISPISYNILNLPSKISVTGMGTIYYTYDAAGSKLRRRMIDSTTLPGIQSTTPYLGATLYQNDTLQFFGTAEGRSREAALLLATLVGYANYCDSYS